jgi:hypothetical protein
LRCKTPFIPSNLVDNNIEQLKHVARENAKSSTEPVPAIFNDIVVHVAQHNDRDAMTAVLPIFSFYKSFSILYSMK